MKIIFAGNNLRAHECLNYLVKKSIQPILVIAHKKEEKSNYFKNLKSLAKKLKIKYVSPDNINLNIYKKQIQKIKPDLMILCGYSQNILKKDIFEIPKHGTWNLHASDLPKYRGAAPLNWAIINNEKKVGISIIEVDKSIDGGDILSKKFIKLKKNETIKTLTEKVNNIYPKMLFREIIKLKKRKVKKIKQNNNEATFFSKRYPNDSYLDFNTLTANQIQKIINASTYPYSQAFFFYKHKKFSVNANTEIVKNHYGIPGRVIKKSQSSITVICKENAIKLNEITYKDSLINPIKLKIKTGSNLNN